jgi:hypothetical protein
MTVKVDQHATTRIDDNAITSVGGHQLVEIEKTSVANIGLNYAINVGTGPGGVAINGDERRDPFGLRPAAYALNSDAIGAGPATILCRRKAQSMSMQAPHIIRMLMALPWNGLGSR